MRELLEEAHRRFIAKRLVPSDLLFPQQKKFSFSPARFKVALNTRRSGKSFLIADDLLEAAWTTPGSQNPYVSLTRDSGKRILWPTIEEIVETCKIPCKLIESRLTVEFANTASVFLVGADQKNFGRKLLGIKAKKAKVDEAQSFGPHLKNLVEDILTPTLVDFNGSLGLFGTPGPRPFGYYYDITTGAQPGWEVHKWSVLDNPHVPNAQDFMEELLRIKGWTRDHPTFRREWLGEWVLDEDSLLFRFHKSRNLYSEAPKSSLSRIIGIDFGWHDKTAFVVVAYSSESKKTFIESATQFAKMIPTEIAEYTKGLIERYSPVKIVADTGGLGKSIVEEMRRRHQIPVEAAEKSEKLTAIELVNDAFRTSDLLVHASLTELIEQLESTAKNERGIEEDGAPFDLCDATIYAYRESKSFFFEPKTPQMDRNSEEYLLKEIENEARRENNEDWWERDV